MSLNLVCTVLHIFECICLINIGTRAMTMYFLKIATVTLTLSPGP